MTDEASLKHFFFLAKNQREQVPLMLDWEFILALGDQ